MTHQMAFQTTEVQISQQCLPKIANDAAKRNVGLATLAGLKHQPDPIISSNLEIIDVSMNS